MKKFYTVTGGTGYIGSKLLEHLSKDKNNFICAIVRENSKPKVYKENIKYVVFDGTEESIQNTIEVSDYLVHLAAFYDTRTDEQTTKDLIESNILLSTMLFNIANKVNPKIVISTASTFSAINGRGEDAPSTLYAATKQAVETIAKYYNNLSIHFLTFPDTYGPEDWRNKIHNILKRNENWPFQFKSRSDQKILMLHVEDVIGYILTSLQIVDKGVHIHDIYSEGELITLETLSKRITNEKCLFNESAEMIEIPLQAREISEDLNYKKKHNKFKL